MRLKKSYSAMIGFHSEHIDNGDGTYHVKAVPFEMIPQREIMMHELEEKMTLSHWAFNEYIASIPSMPLKEDEHEWMIEHGPEYVKQKRLEAQKVIDAMQQKKQELEKAWRDAEKAWNEHCQWCGENGYDHDTYTGPKDAIIKGDGYASN